MKNRRSPKWAFFEKFEVPNFDHPEQTYLTRWRLFETPWFGIFIHKLHQRDPRSTLHDHPWAFRSFVLRGSYIESRLDPNTSEIVLHRVNKYNKVRASDSHCIVAVVPNTLTFVITGKRVRRWGFSEFHDHGILWTPFDKHPQTEEFNNAIIAREKINSNKKEKS